MTHRISHSNRLLNREWRNTWIVTWFFVWQAVRVTAVVAPVGLIWAEGVWQVVGYLYTIGLAMLLSVPTAIEVMHIYDLLCLLGGKQGNMVRALARAGAERAREERPRESTLLGDLARWAVTFLWRGNPMGLVTIPLSVLVVLIHNDALDTYRADIAEAIQEGFASRARRSRVTGPVTGEIRIITHRTARIGRAAFAPA